MTANELNILVVEDDDFQRRMMVKMLRTLGTQSVSAAANGKEALDLIRTSAAKVADIALCDLNMPQMDGMEFLRHLSEERRNIAIVITSALDNKLLASVARMARMYGLKLLGVLEKPITVAQLQNSLAEYEHTENKWHRSDIADRYELAEIMQGIHTAQFEPYLQPQVDIRTGRVVGAEALARWNHPADGTVCPAAFIPILEQSGSIDDLTFQILEKSAIASRTLQDRGHKLSISVNLSLVSLENPKLAERITTTVHNAGVDPRDIVLEITESTAMTDGPYALENLARLSMHGFTLSIDDYGTGYSNLQQLTRVAFSELKIDQSFVKDCATNEGLAIVVDSSVDMARKLRLKTVAEGVETAHDWEMLKNMGCDIAQGYYIARPMNLHAFVQFCGSNP